MVKCFTLQLSHTLHMSTEKLFTCGGWNTISLTTVSSWLTIILTFNDEMFHITIITHHTHVHRVTLLCGGWNTISKTTVSSWLTIILTFNGEMFHITVITHHTHVDRVALHLWRLEYYIHDNCVIMAHNNTFL